MHKEHNCSLYFSPNRGPFDEGQRGLQGSATQGAFAFHLFLPLYCCPLSRNESGVGCFTTCILPSLSLSLYHLVNVYLMNGAVPIQRAAEQYTAALTEETRCYNKGRGFLG